MQQVPQMDLYDPQSYANLAGAAGVGGLKGMALHKLMNDSGFNQILGVAKNLHKGVGKVPPINTKTAGVEDLASLNHYIERVADIMSPTRYFMDDILFYAANPDAIPGHARRMREQQNQSTDENLNIKPQGPINE